MLLQKQSLMCLRPRRATGSEPGAPAPPGWRVGENSRHSAALLGGVYPFKRNQGEGGGATKGGCGAGLLRSARGTGLSLRLTLLRSSPAFPLFFFSFDTKVGL